MILDNGLFLNDDIKIIMSKHIRGKSWGLQCQIIKEDHLRRFRYAFRGQQSVLVFGIERLQVQ